MRRAKGTVGRDGCSKSVKCMVGLFVLSLPYPQYFGGVSALTPDQYLKMNGFPNEYWGWGGEDDDIATRLEFSPHLFLKP